MILQFADFDSLTEEECWAETIAAIRAKNERFNKLTNEQLRELYRQWSQEQAFSDWLVWNEQILDGFIHWATTAPIDDPRNYCTQL